jgi:dihydrofolate synthase/folylpolyglutamate synthase
LSVFAASSLDEWFAHQARVHPHSIDLGLGRLSEVLARLHWRTPAVPVITVAGTNGKGSVVATCAAILTAAGLRAGTFTSPHLRDYRERIGIDGQAVTTEALLAAFARIETARGDIGLTFFEYNTLAALLIFADSRLDVWVLEVGMGGRLDAVNVVDPDVAVIVSIGLDHQEFLGPTLEDIGREKAGILRAGKPAVLGSRSMPGVVELTAREKGAVLKRLGQEYDCVRGAGVWHYRGTRWDLPQLPAPNLRGATQYDNAATAIAAVEALALPVPAEAVARGLAQVRLIGRFQVIASVASAGPTWILDVAHNPDAARVLASNLRELPGVGRNLAVCGILGDKDAIGIVDALRDCIDAWYFVSLSGERGRSAAALAKRVAAQLTSPAIRFDDMDTACAAALRDARADDRIVVFGSFHTVGPALDWLQARGLGF